MRCIWSEAWIGQCTDMVPEAQESLQLCEKHAVLKCCSCGSQATHSCDHTGAFVCGMPLCAACVHGPQAPQDKQSMAGMGGGHWPKLLATRMRLEWWDGEQAYFKETFPEEYEQVMRYRLPTEAEYKLRNSGHLGIGILMSLLTEQNQAALPLHMLAAMEDTPSQLEYLI